jgi:hypothetical protein
MKKIFLTILGIFALSIAFSFSAVNNDLTANAAFANHTCCYESESSCPKGDDTGWSISNHVKKTGSCKATSLQNNLTP